MMSAISFIRLGPAVTTSLPSLSSVTSLSAGKSVMAVTASLMVCGVEYAMRNARVVRVSATFASPSRVPTTTVFDDSM